jgi:SAM-dependent methyltransferase
MPRILKTIEQQVRLFQESSARSSVFRSALRALYLPYKIVQRYRQSIVNCPRVTVSDEFDREHGVETSLRVHVTDLHIASANWIHALAYFPTPSRLLTEMFAGLDFRFQDFTFIDLGSGKGRVLLMASEFPFRRIIGIEFSPELHAVAQRNISSYKGTQKCADVRSVCMDFMEFEFPEDPFFVFLYNPASQDLTSSVARNLRRSVEKSERRVWVLYVTPQEQVFDSEGFTKVKAGECCGHPYSLYSAQTAGTQRAAWA